MNKIIFPEEINQKKIIYTEWAVANHFRDHIELHKDLNLPEYKLLKEKILNHELDHDFEKGFIHNLEVDLFHMVNGLLPFMAKRPKTWIQLLPIYYSKGKGIVYDKNMILFYLFVFLSTIVSGFALIKFIGGI